MKLAFAHDHVFQKDIEGKLYTGGSFNNQAWKRYLNHFEKITVLARVETLSDNNNNKEYNKFDLPETRLTPVPSISGPIKQITNKKKAIKQIKKTLLESDALIARLPSEIGNLSIKIAKELEIPYAVEVVACVWDALWNHGSYTAKLYAPIAYYKMKKNIKESPYTVYVTKEFLQKRYPTHGITTNISNVEINEVLTESYQNRKKRLVNKKSIKIGMIGSLKNNIKGWDTTFKSLKELNDEGINFHFYALGDGDMNKWTPITEKLNISDRITFCGVLPGGNPVLNWLDGIDLYIQPSYQEGLPRAVIEAMSRGCPVIGSNAGGIPELINNKYVHEVGNFKELTEKIKILVNDNEEMMEATEENLLNAKLYEKSILDFNRKEFWNSFVANEVLKVK